MESRTESKQCTGLSTGNQWIEAALTPPFLRGKVLLALEDRPEHLRGSDFVDSTQKTPFMIKKKFLTSDC